MVLEVLVLIISCEGLATRIPSGTNNLVRFLLTSSVAFISLVGAISIGLFLSRGSLIASAGSVDSSVVLDASIFVPELARVATLVVVLDDAVGRRPSVVAPSSVVFFSSTAAGAGVGDVCTSPNLDPKKLDIDLLSPVDRSRYKVMPPSATNSRASALNFLVGCREDMVLAR